MEIEIDLNKSVDENAGIYFNAAKKAKKKLHGAKIALEESKKKLVLLQQEEQQFWRQEEQKKQQTERKREWYEKFHWFISSEGYLCIGGRDATSNEVLIKKHLEQNDLVFHTEMPGSPFFIIKDGQKAVTATVEETAQAAAIYSRAWKLGHTLADVFYVLPEQVTKQAQSGEYLSKGSFMVYGKKTHLQASLQCAIGLLDGKIIGGPVNAIKKQTNNFWTIIPGEEKKSDLAKKIKAKLNGGELDDIISFLPAGEGTIKKN